MHQIVQSRREQLLQKKHKLEKLLSKAPEGSLIYSKTVIRNRSYFKWYSSTPSGRHYISRHNNLLMEENSAPVNELSEELEKWASEPYEMNPKYPENKTIRAINGLMVRSKSEAFIVMLLVTYHIPFRYECKLELDGQIIYPDFTIRHPVTGETFYWEHAGMLEDPKYISKHLYTLRFFLSTSL